MLMLKQKKDEEERSYNVDWEKEDWTQGWLTRSDLSNRRKQAHCKVCHKDYRAHTSDLQKHAETQTHMKNMGSPYQQLKKLFPSSNIKHNRMITDFLGLLQIEKADANTLHKSECANIGCAYDDLKNLITMIVKKILKPSLVSDDFEAIVQALNDDSCYLPIHDCDFGIEYKLSLAEMNITKESKCLGIMENQYNKLLSVDWMTVLGNKRDAYSFWDQVSIFKNAGVERLTPLEFPTINAASGTDVTDVDLKQNMVALEQLFIQPVEEIEIEYRNNPILTLMRGISSRSRSFGPGWQLPKGPLAAVAATKHNKTTNLKALIIRFQFLVTD
ncbi:hypothetical protein TSAR_004939 [Trichomalopsis sarcophagae]|uniref:Uncharacterized protein n=1 Tax=Trichomalopsis sarcophagae TaxID=543379 RepID=A0A232EPB6_9HYME|nr:hypothetical protein TSAR_004939 [Trichomalopsis sarcophagae]